MLRFQIVINNAELFAGFSFSKLESHGKNRGGSPSIQLGVWSIVVSSFIVSGLNPDTMKGGKTILGAFMANKTRSCVNHK